MKTLRRPSTCNPTHIVGPHCGCCCQRRMFGTSPKHFGAAGVCVGSSAPPLHQIDHIAIRVPSTRTTPHRGLTSNQARRRVILPSRYVLSAAASPTGTSIEESHHIVNNKGESPSQKISFSVFKCCLCSTFVAVLYIEAQ